jgi:ABC-type sugar transport system ATPase subunit
MPGLIIENLTKSFDGQKVLDDINIKVREGDLTVVLGPSGCGKSTLLRLISGLEAADGGRIILDGQDMTSLEPQKRKTAMVFQNYALYPHMTVFENIAFPLKVSRLSKSEIKKNVYETAVLLELDKLLDRRPAQLSGGQRQRVALGRGLVRQPSIFLLDEPLSNLDAALRIKMRREIVALQKRLGITAIYVTHDQTEALTMADRLVVLKDGRVRQEGTPAEIYNNPRDIFVASFVGTPTINLIDDEISGGLSKLLPIRFGPGIKDGEYTVGIRPENIKIDPKGAVTGRVESLEYIGSITHLHLRINNAMLTVTCDGINAGSEDVKNKTADQMIGRKLGLNINSEKVFLFDAKTGRRVGIIS